MCQAFNCPPSVALRQDALLVIAVLEHRMLVQAREMHNSDVTELQKHPQAVRLWLEMTGANDG